MKNTYLLISTNADLTLFIILTRTCETPKYFSTNTVAYLKKV